MATERLQIEISGDASGAVGATERAEGALAALARSVGLTNTRMTAGHAILRQQGRNLQFLARWGRRAAVAASGLAIFGVAKLAQEGIKLNAQWESINASFATFLGNTKQAEKFTERLRKVSAKSPLRLTEYAEAAQLLMGFGVAADDTVPLLKALNKAIVATGKGEEDMQRAALALGQIEAKGKASAEELNQLAEIGVPVNKILQKELGLTGEQIANIGDEGVKSEEALAAIARGWNREYSKAFAEAADTFNFQTSNLVKNFEQVLRLSTEPLFEVVRDQWLPTLNNAAQSIVTIWERKDLTPEQKFESSFRVIKRRIGPLLADIGDAISRADLPRRFGDALEAAIPVIAETGGRMAIILARSFVRAFLEADLIGKLFLGGLFIRALGGWALFGIIGRRIGATIAAGLIGGTAAGVAGGAGAAGLAGVLGGRAGAAGRGGLAGALRGKIKGMSGRFRAIGKIGIGAVIAGGIIAAFESEDFLSAVGDALGAITSILPGGGSRRDVTEGLGRKDAEKLWPGVNKVDLDKVLGPSEKRWDAFWRNVRRRSDTGGRDIEESARRHLLQNFANQILGDTARKGEKSLGKDLPKSAEKGKRDVSRATGRMGLNVGANVSGMVNAVGDGLRTLRDNTNRSLKAMKVGSVEWRIENQKRSGGFRPQFRARGGMIDQGAPSGDTVPAMLERGEFVLNRRAVEGMGGPRILDAINFGMFPRRGFQTGGLAGLKPGISRLAQFASRRFGLRISSGLRPGDTDSFHGSGEAVDLIPPGMRATRGIFSAFRNQLTELFYDPWGGFDNGRMIGPIGGHLDHIHAAIMGAGRGPVAALAKVLLKGPPGPLRDLGQASLDRVHRAASQRLATAGGSHGNLAVPTGPIQAMARRLIGQVWGMGQWSPFAELVMRESGWDPTAVNPSSGAAGLAQALPPSKYPAGAWPYRGLSSAKKQLQWMVGYIRGRYGNPAGALAFHDRNNFYRSGGFVGMRSGGVRAPRRPRTLGGIRHHLQTQARRIGLLDERIDIAGRKAAFAQGPGGEGMTEGEQRRLVVLNRKLLGTLRNRGRTLKGAIRFPRTSGSEGGRKVTKGEKRRIANWRESLREVQGLTGRGGRIFDTKEAIKQLLATPTSASERAEELARLRLESLRETRQRLRLSEAQFAAFSGLNFPGLPLVGAFKHGGRVHVPGGGAGLGILHDNETVIPDGGAGNIILNLDLKGDFAFAERVNAEIRGQGVKTVDTVIGRRGRQRAVAPGR